MDITRQRLVGRVTAVTRRAARTGRQASDLHDFSREIGPTTFACESSPVTASLYARLTAEDVAEVEAAAREHPELAGLLDASTESGHRQRVIINSALWLRVQPVIDKLGLDRHDPPEVVHAMARGPLAVAGGLYEADLIVDALVSVGVDPDALETALDFGCSSGRVVRVLSHLWPETRWLGCDPNAQAIGWARESIPSAEFFVNAWHPPLPIGDATLDLVYAISIWSHFSVSAGTQWFDEMHRVIRPGGTLLFTTHGLQSIAFLQASGHRSTQELAEARDWLYRRGWWYAADFAGRGDAGIVDPEWGTSLLSPEWVLDQLCPKWRVLEYAIGRNQDNQDVYVVERV